MDSASRLWARLKRKLVNTDFGILQHEGKQRRTEGANHIRSCEHHNSPESSQEAATIEADMDGPKDKPIGQDVLSLHEASEPRAQDHISANGRLTADQQAEEQTAPPVDDRQAESTEIETSIEVAIELYDADQAVRATLNWKLAIDDGLREGKDIVTTLEQDIQNFVEEDSVANAYAVDRAREQIDYVEYGLSQLKSELSATEQELRGARARRNDLISGFVRPFLDEHQILRHLFLELSAEVLEAAGRFVEVQTDLGEERTRRNNAEHREQYAQDRIQSIKDHLTLDGHLGQADEASITLAERMTAHYEGVVEAATWQVDLRERNITSLLRYKDDADAMLCSAIGWMLRNSGLVNAETEEHSRSLYSDEYPYKDASLSDPNFEAHGDTNTLRHAATAFNLTLENRLRATKARARLNLATAHHRFGELRTHYPTDLLWFNMTSRQRASRTELDHRYLQSRRDWTGRIIAAEQELRSARLAIQAEGLRPSDVIESGFADLEEDGYLESLEAATTAQVDRAKLESWLDSVEDQGVFLGDPAQDDWPDDVDDKLSVSERSALLDVTDSISCVAEGKSKDRIRDWYQRRYK